MGWLFRLSRGLPCEVDSWEQAGGGRPPVGVRLAEAWGRWDGLMAAHHYLGFRIPVGESLKCVAEQEGRWLALLGWSGFLAVSSG